MVRDGVDGLHARPNDPHDLARAMARLIEEPGLLAQLASGVAPPPTIDATAATHLELFAPERSAQTERAEGEWA